MRRTPAFTRALKLSAFNSAGMTLLKRVALVLDGMLITVVFCPVFQPDENAAQVIARTQACK